MPSNSFLYAFKFFLPAVKIANDLASSIQRVFSHTQFNDKDIRVINSLFL